MKSRAASASNNTGYFPTALQHRLRTTADEGTHRSTSDEKAVAAGSSAPLNDISLFDADKSGGKLDINDISSGGDNTVETRVKI